MANSVQELLDREQQIKNMLTDPLVLYGRPTEEFLVDELHIVTQKLADAKKKGGK